MKRSPRNKTLSLTDEERNSLSNELLVPNGRELQLRDILNKTIHSDLFSIVDDLPKKFADLIIIDPPYNLTKNFGGTKFSSRTKDEYKEYLNSWFPKIVELLKDDGSLYMCGDWKSTSVMQEVMEEHLTVLNRITWQREKGRGARSNWKNGMEDIWFGVRNKNNYYFDVDAVKVKRKVIAPYKENDQPKDWVEDDDGKFRLTHPSNFWDHITVPFWSMPENTDHPTQKPEKLIAKLILASCPPDGIVFDPFLGSGTTSVVARKLNRNFAGIEMNHEYCLWTEKRLERALINKKIQGYEDGVFWERNSGK